MEVAGVALVVDALAFGLPELAASVSGDGSRVEALLGLLPALLGRGPAALLSSVVRNLGAAPVGVLDEAAGGLLALGLSSLARGSGLCGVGSELCELGAGELVGGGVLVVDVEAGAGLAVVDISRDGDGGLRDEVAVALEEDLGTAGVELGVVVVCGVKSEELGASEVVAALKAGRKLDVEETIIVDDLVRAPAVSVGVVAVLHDLEPAIASSCISPSVCD